MQKFGQFYICPICYKQNQCTEGTVTYLGLVVQSRVRFNPGLKFNPLFYSSFSISVSFKIITETKITIDAGKICKKYLEAYKQIAVKFLLNFTLTQGYANWLLNNWLPVD